MAKKLVSIVVTCLAIFGLYSIVQKILFSNTDVQQPLVVENVAAAAQVDKSPKTSVNETPNHGSINNKVAKVPLTAHSNLKQKLCSDYSKGCLARLNVDYSKVLSNLAGDIQTESVGILLQSNNFNEVFSQFSTQKSLPEAYNSETTLQSYVQANTSQFPSAVTQVACSDTVCMIELDVDSQTDLKALSAIVHSQNWPMGSTVIVPVYAQQRLKFRAVSTRVHHVGSGVIVGGSSD